MVVDESHVTLSQVHAMYGGDRSRKENLVEYGFRLPAAMDNRPCTLPGKRRNIHFKNVYQSSLLQWICCLPPWAVIQPPVFPTSTVCPREVGIETESNGRCTSQT